MPELTDVRCPRQTYFAIVCFVEKRVNEIANHAMPMATKAYAACGWPVKNRATPRAA